MEADVTLFDATDDYIANEFAMRIRPQAVIYATADGRLRSSGYVGKEGYPTGRGPFGPRIGSKPPSFELTVAHLERAFGDQDKDWKVLHNTEDALPENGLDGLVERFREYQAEVAPDFRPA